MSDLLRRLRMPLQFRTIDGVDVQFHPADAIEDLLEEAGDFIENLLEKEEDMEELDDLKNSAKQLELAIRMTDAAGPNPQQTEVIIERGCEAFANVVALVKAIWKRP